MADKKQIDRPNDEVPQTREELFKKIPIFRPMPELDEKLIERMILTLEADDRFLGAIGAFSEGHGKFGDFLDRIRWATLPKDFDFDHMVEVTGRFLKRIESGRFKIPQRVKEQFKEFWA